MNATFSLSEIINKSKNQKQIGGYLVLNFLYKFQAHLANRMQDSLSTVDPLMLERNSFSGDEIVCSIRVVAILCGREDCLAWLVLVQKS